MMTPAHKWRSCRTNHRQNHQLYSNLTMSIVVLCHWYFLLYENKTDEIAVIWQMQYWIRLPLRKIGNAKSAPHGREVLDDRKLQPPLRATDGQSSPEKRHFAYCCLPRYRGGLLASPLSSYPTIIRTSSATFNSQKKKHQKPFYCFLTT